MTAWVLGGQPLPGIFPDLGPATRLVLFADFAEDGSVPGAEAWRNERELLIGHGLSGIARRVINERSIPVPGDVLDALQQAQFAEMALSALTVNQSRAGLDALRSAEIRFTVTKGAGIALVARSVAERPYVDLDVLVEPERFMEAKAVLRKLDYVERNDTRQPWEAFDRHCREAVNLRTTAGGSIDLHHRISPWYWSGALSRSVLGEEGIPTVVFGVELPLVSPVHNLLVCALHVVSDKSHPGQTLRAWRDLLILAEACPVDAVVTTARENGLADWLGWILNCLPPEVQPTELVAGLVGSPPDLRGRFRLKMLLRPGIGVNPLFGQVFRLPIPNAAVLAAGMLVPSRAFLRRRYPGGSGNYRTWWREAVGNIN